MYNLCISKVEGSFQSKIQKTATSRIRFNPKRVMGCTKKFQAQKQFGVWGALPGCAAVVTEGKEVGRQKKITRAIPRRAAIVHARRCAVAGRPAHRDRLVAPRRKESKKKKEKREKREKGEKTEGRTCKLRYFCIYTTSASHFCWLSAPSYSLLLSGACAELIGHEAPR